MAVLVATANGNLSAGATWGVVDATALLDSEANNTALGTAYTETAGFTPGAIVVDAIAVKVAARNATPTGTISVRLAQAGATVAGTECTINVSDIDSRNAEQGWYLFKFAAPVTLAAATVYTLSAKTSNAAMVNLYRNATVSNWSRLLRTTTTGAPAAGDTMHILGEWTAAATKTDRTVTQDLTAATDFGDNTPANPPGFTIGKGGTLTWGTTAATNYILRVSQRVVIYRGGTMNMGTTGTPCPRDSSMELQLDVAAADGDYGLVVYGTLTTQGLSRTSGKNIVRCQLNTDEAAAQTVLGVDTDTGWKNTDDIAIASTTQTPGQAETRTLNVDAGASSVTVSVGLTNAHSGTSPTAAEVLLLTRNVRIHSTSTTLMAYVYFGGAAVVDCDWTAFRYLGATGTGKRGIEVDVTSAGSLTMSFCSIREFDNHGIFVASASSDNFSIDNLTGYKVGNQSTNHSGINVALTTGTNWSLSNIDIVSGNTSQGAGVSLATVGGQLTNIRCNSGGGDGLTIAILTAGCESIHKTWSGFEMHSNTQAGISVDGIDFAKLQNVNLWRNNAGASFGGLYMATLVGELVIETGNFFGNSTQNIFWSTASGSRRLILRSVNLSGDSSFASASGIQFGAVANSNIRAEFDNCTFGTATGIKVAHTTADINIGASSNRYGEIILRNTKLDSATEINNQSGLRGRSYIKYERVDQATNVHKTVWPRLGTSAYETTTFRTAAPSQKLTPSGRGAGEKLESGPKRKRIANGGTVAISVYVRKNGAYTGNAPRLMQRANPAIGVLTDTVIATHSAAADAWQQLSGTTAAATENGVAEFFVDCDGSVGDVFVDDWT
jgi:hypothetical protein